MTLERFLCRLLLLLLLLILILLILLVVLLAPLPPKRRSRHRQFSLLVNNRFNFPRVFIFW